jgi:hypothetical protein
MSEIPRALCKRWRHSREEDTDEEEVYRPETYNLPPSRYRNSFEICENGEFVQYGITSGDRPSKSVGKFKIVKDDTTNIITNVPSTPEIKIVSYDDNMLRIKKPKFG